VATHRAAKAVRLGLWSLGRRHRWLVLAGILGEDLVVSRIGISRVFRSHSCGAGVSRSGTQFVGARLG
jgi:hypothetical protein